jgi:ABC-type transport system involved in Fe-S cluster assembly fused permease/ATPase subunit
MTERTTLVIAHRLSTIRNAIVSWSWLTEPSPRGTHEELLARKTNTADFILADIEEETSLTRNAH